MVVVEAPCAASDALPTVLRKRGVWWLRSWRPSKPRARRCACGRTLSCSASGASTRPPQRRWLRVTLQEAATMSVRRPARIASAVCQSTATTRLTSPCGCGGLRCAGCITRALLTGISGLWDDRMHSQCTSNDRPAVQAAAALMCSGERGHRWWTSSCCAAAPLRPPARTPSPPRSTTATTPCPTRAAAPCAPCRRGGSTAAAARLRCALAPSSRACTSTRAAALSLRCTNRRAASSVRCAA